MRKLSASRWYVKILDLRKGKRDLGAELQGRWTLRNSGRRGVNRKAVQECAERGEKLGEVSVSETDGESF